MTFMTFIYGSPKCTKRLSISRDLKQLAGSMVENWVLISDFNAYLTLSENLGGANLN